MDEIYVVLLGKSLTAADKYDRRATGDDGSLSNLHTGHEERMRRHRRRAAARVPLFPIVFPVYPADEADHN